MGDASYRLLGDLKFSLQILEHGAYVNIDEPGLFYRRHPNSDYAIIAHQRSMCTNSLRLVSEFNWWNPLNCAVAFLRGGVEARRVVRKHWRQACAPRRLAKSLEAFADFLYMRLRRFLRQAQLCSSRFDTDPATEKI